MATEGARPARHWVLAVALALAGCGVGGEEASGPGGSTTTTTGATTVTTGTTTTATTEPTTTSAEDALTAVRAGVTAVVDAGTGSYHATLHLVAPGVDTTVTYDGTWDAGAGLLQVVMRITSPDEDAEITILNDGSGGLYLRQPEISGDPDRPWVRLDAADIEDAGGEGIGIPAAPAPGEPPTPLTSALSGTPSAEAAGDGFAVEVTGADALVLASSHAMLGGLGGIDLDAVNEALPGTVTIDVTLDGDGRLAAGSADVAAVAVAVLRGSGELVEGTEEAVEAEYAEEIVSLGGAVDIAVPDPSEVIDAGD